MQHKDVDQRKPWPQMPSSAKGGLVGAHGIEPWTR